jgi:NAD(P)-dependent dehydrogenase (short-subunit alcohol dehydrogenase family)
MQGISMPTILVTGANRGIGLELVRQYAAEGWRVIATCRDPLAATELLGVAGDVVVHRLDMLDHAGMRGLADQLSARAIDVLFLNAGINPQHGAALGQTAFDDWTVTLQTNTIGPLFAASVFLDHIARSERKIVVAMGSMAGSSKSTVAGNYLYRSSKAALHSVMKALAEEVRDKGIAVVVMHPGRVRGQRAPDSPLAVETSVAGLRQVIAGLGIVDGGRFLDYEGRGLPW